MIPLRILHAVAGADGAAGDALRAVCMALAADGHANAAWTPAGRLVSEIETIHHPGPLWRWWLAGRTAVLQPVAAWTPDVVHVHQFAGVPATLRLARALALPVIVSLAELPATGGRSVRDPRVAWAVAPNDAVRAQAMTSRLIERDKVAVVPLPLPFGDGDPARVAEALVALYRGAMGDSGPGERAEVSRMWRRTEILERRRK